MKECFNCGKATKSGYIVSHSHKKSKRSFFPNLHSRTLRVNNHAVKVKLCTQCIKNMSQ